MNPKISNDQRFMEEALLEAKKGLTSAHPNPRVGCVFVKDNLIIARGFHAKTGLLHAERDAISKASTSLESSTCYVTLEPCAHFGRTPPCTHALIEQRIKRCVIACLDPNELVSGRGIAELKEAGIEVEVGVLEEEAARLNQGFFKRMQKGLPLVIAKVASSVDGKTAMANGQSQWITSEESRQDAHTLRAQVGAIMTGYKTINTDNAKLTVRHPCTENSYFRQPLRVIVDSQLRVEPQAEIFKQPGQTMVAVSDSLSEEAIKNFKAALSDGGGDCLIVRFKLAKGHIDLKALLTWLASQQQINEVLLESGHELLGAFIEQRLVDNFVFYIAPKILGANTKGMFHVDLESLDRHIPLSFEEFVKVGSDLKVTATIREL